MTSTKLISAEKNIKVGIVISYLTLIINVIISIIYTPFLLRHIGQSQYGLNSFVTSITSWFTVLSSALVSSYVRFATRESLKKGNDGVKAINSVYLIIFSAISLFVCLVGISFFFIMKYAILPSSVYKDNQTSINIILVLTVISTTSIVISIVGNLFGLYNNWKQKFIVTKCIALAINVLQPLCTIPFLLMGMNVIAVVLIQLFFTIAGIVLHLLSAVKLYGFAFSKSFKNLDKSLFKEILIFSSFIILNSVVDQINNSADKTILGFMVNDEAKSVAIYQAGIVFKNYLEILTVSISSAFSTKINEAVVLNDRSRLNHIFRSVSKIQMILILFVVGGFATFGKNFIVLWLGEEFYMSYYVALILFLLCTVPYTENTAVTIQRAMNKHKFRAILYVCIAVFNVGITISLVYLFSPENAIWGCLIGTAFANILGHWVAINIYNFKVIKIDVKGYIIDLLTVGGGALISFGLSKGLMALAGISDNVIYLFGSSLLYVCFYVVYVLLFHKKFVVSFFKKGTIETL